MLAEEEKVAIINKQRTGMNEWMNWLTSTCK